MTPPPDDRTRRDVFTTIEDATARQPTAADDGIHQGGFAGAVGADDTMQPAFMRHFHADVDQRLEAAVVDAEVGDLQHVSRAPQPA